MLTLVDTRVAAFLAKSGNVDKSANSKAARNEPEIMIINL